MPDSSATARSTATCGTSGPNSRRSAAIRSRRCMASVTSWPAPERTMRLRPRLPGIRTLLLATYLAVLLLPFAGIGILRLYESALIRQTEAELMAQAAVLSAAYRAEWLDRAPADALASMPRVDLQWSTTDYG